VPQAYFSSRKRLIVAYFSSRKRLIVAYFSSRKRLIVAYFSSRKRFTDSTVQRGRAVRGSLSGILTPAQPAAAAGQESTHVNSR
jgi:hypothetical protein